MKKSDFLYEVREKIRDKPADSLKMLVLEFARYIPKEEREQSLIFLDKETRQKNYDGDIQVVAEDICKKAEDGEYALNWEAEGDYYWTNDDEELLIDHDGLGEQIENCLKEAIECVQKKQYEKAFKVFDLMFGIHLPLESADECENLNILAMFKENLIGLEISKVLCNYAYATIMTLEGVDMFEKLYEIETYSKYIPLRDIIDKGVPEADNFLAKWIEFLMNRDLQEHEDILIDAIKLKGDTDALYDFVMLHGTKYRDSYIELVLQYMNDKQYYRAAQIAEIGLEKCETDDDKRTRMADLLYEAGKLADDKVLARKGLMEGFSSSKDLDHFMALYHLRDQSIIELAIQMLGNYDDDTSEDVLYMRFLYGDYETIWERCEKNKEFLGWTCSTKGRMLPLFIALLSESAEIKSCTRKLISNTFLYESSLDRFIDILASNRKNISHLNYMKYWEWCLKETEGRIEAVIRGQHRGSYHKVSMLITAMAETIRSREGTERAVRFIVKYKERYPRYKAFLSYLYDDMKLGGFGSV